MGSRTRTCTCDTQVGKPLFFDSAVYPCGQVAKTAGLRYAQHNQAVWEEAKEVLGQMKLGDIDGKLLHFENGCPYNRVLSAHVSFSPPHNLPKLLSSGDNSLIFTGDLPAGGRSQQGAPSKAAATAGQQICPALQRFA